MASPRSVYYVQYANPAGYPPLEHSARLLSAAGFSITFIGKEATGQANRMAFDSRLAARQIRWGHRAPGVGQKLHYAAFCLYAFWRVRRDRPSWVYCSDQLSCITARLVKRYTRVPVVYHEHDAPTSEETRSVFGRYLWAARRWVGRYADLVVIPNEVRLREFRRETGRMASSLCVFNAPRREEVRPVRSPRSGGELRLVYHGSINPERLPLSVLSAMRSLDGGCTLDVIGYGVPGSVGHVDSFLVEAKRLGLTDSVRFSGAHPRAHMLGLSSEADVGLAFMPMVSSDLNMTQMVGASNKPFDYLSCGLALLVSDLTGWRRSFVEPGYGLACDPRDSHSIAAVLRRLRDNPAETRAMGERGRQQILAEWNYETQFAPVLRALMA